jgi:hypothetical protein
MQIENCQLKIETWQLIWRVTPQPAGKIPQAALGGSWPR